MKNYFSLAMFLLIIITCCNSLRAQDSLKIRMRNEAQQCLTEKDYAIDEIRKDSQLIIEPEKQPLVQKTAAKEYRQPEMPAIDSMAAEIPDVFAIKVDYNNTLADALLLQIKADSLARIVRDMRIMAKEAPDEEIMKQLVTTILKTDKEAKRFQREADMKFNEARNLKDKNEVALYPDDSLLHISKEINGISIYQYKNGVPDDFSNTMQAPEPKRIPTVVSEDSIKSTKTDDFIFLDESPYNESNPIPQGLKIYPGLVYRIQLGVFSKSKPNDAFGGISPVSFEQLAGSTILKYFAGLFYSVNTVNNALENVRSYGFPDAFVVAFFDGKPISTEKAREIEFAGFKLQ